MPICIAGMHRSGTSMIARMLNLCGLYLGEESELHAAKPDNPEGFWEHIGFQDINDKLLALFGGAWDVVPELPEDWLQTPEVLSAKQEAKALVAEFEGRGKGVWGWKDPRNSITLPFWKQVIPDLKVVVALRNPVDVAASLTKRAYASEKFGIGLWQAYMDAILPNLEPANTLYTHYSTYFQYPAEELARVNAFCGLHPTADQETAACGTVSGGLRHSDATFGDLLASEAESETIRTYFAACIAAGPAYEKVWRSEAAALAGTMRDLEVLNLKEQLKSREAQIAEAKETIEAVYGKFTTEISQMQTGHRQKLEQMHRQVLKTASLRVGVEKELGRLRQELINLRAESAELRPKAALADRFEPYIRELGANRALRMMLGASIRMRQGGVVSVGKGVAKKVLKRVAPGVLPTSTSSAPLAAEAPAAPKTVAQILGVAEEPMSEKDLQQEIRARLQHKTYALATSHDSFQAFTGGIQTVIREEMQEFSANGVSHIHLCPAQGGQSSGQLMVSVEGKAIGIARGEDLLSTLETLRAEGITCGSVQVHHLMNWDLSLLKTLLEGAPKDRKFFWIHDYFTVCEGYNLLRNDRAFCNAPPPESNSCMVCRYGKTRVGHLARMGDFLRGEDFTFLTPSERAAEIWRRAYQDLADRLKVVPLYSLEPTGRRNLRSDSAGRKIKLAYVGITYEQKGWSLWRRLVDVLAADPNYELVHLGQRTKDLLYAEFPERWERVRSGPENPNAMPEALEREQVDIVFYCPIWPETFSLIAYEAQAIGCWTLTIKDSGNVAAYVENSGSGKVFNSIDALINYLQEPAAVRSDLAARRDHTEFISEMCYDKGIVTSLYGGASLAEEARS